MKSQYVLVFTLTSVLAISACGDKGPSITPEEARAIAKEAYIYASPMVDGYSIIHTYFMAPGNPDYKGPMNKLVNEARVYTPADTTVQTPNSDTPYSFFGADLRAEPLVITVPEIDPKRYYSIQFVDAYTFNFHYVGSRTTGNGAGKFLLVGPGWKGEKPDGIKEVITSETSLVLAIYRTQLLGPDDIDNVKEIQAGYKLEPLSEYLGTAAASDAPAPHYAEPLSKEAQKSSPEVFSNLNFILTAFCPTVPSEEALMTRLAKIDVGPGKTFDLSSFSPEVQQAIKDGIADAWKEFDQFKKDKLDTGEVTSGDIFGTREYLKNNYLYRMAAAVMGIYGNSEQEAVYPLYTVDANGDKLDGSNRYTVRFASGEGPPVHAFASLTMYKLPESLLVANPINRYLINSPMLPELKKDADGGLTLYIQHDSPGKSKESNWLPAPEGPFMMAMRLYWPKEAVLDGTWKAPKAEKVE